MRKLLVVACVMFGFGFALVPFYKKICEVTGVNNVLKADEVANTQVDAARWLTVEFDTNVRDNLPWTFRPLREKRALPSRRADAGGCSKYATTRTAR